MISAATMSALEAQGIDYILGVRERSSRQVRDKVLVDDGAEVPLIIPRQKGETELAIKDITVPGRRYIVSRNEEEAQGEKRLVGNKGYRRFLRAAKDKAFEIDPDKVEADALFDGLFVLRTSLKLQAPAVVLRYRNLLTVEQSFLAAKAIMATRPIFHRTDAAIRGHVFCSFLALVLRRELLDRLAAHASPLPEWHNMIDDLADLSAVEVEQDGRRALLRTAPGASIDPICRALGITLPPVFQELLPTGELIHNP